MIEEDARIVVEMANYNLNIGKVARKVFMHRNTVTYRLDRIKKQTGLDARRFYDLVELLKIAKEVLSNDTQRVH